MTLETLSLGDNVQGKAHKVSKIRSEAVFDYALGNDCFDVGAALVAGINSETVLLVKGKESDL